MSRQPWKNVLAGPLARPGRKIFAGIGLIGRLMVLPVGILPLAGLLLAAGDLLGRRSWPAAGLLTQTGSILLQQTPLLVAVSLAAGLAAHDRGLAAFSALLAYLAMNQTGISMARVLLAGQILPASFDFGLLTGLTAGLLAAWFQRIIPGSRRIGRRQIVFGTFAALVLTCLAAILAGSLAGLAWTRLQDLLVRTAQGISRMGDGGLFLYGLLNRLLLPLGLHHILDQEIWFRLGQYTTQSGLLVHGDVSRFLAGDPTAGRFTAGFFPMMLLVAPSIALAFGLAARRQKRPALIIFLVAAALGSLFGGISEPVDYLILLTSPLLYLLYSLLFGLSLVLSSQLQIRQGFSFSAGLTDYLYHHAQATRPEWLLVIGLVLVALAFFLFYLALKKLHLAFPGFPAPVVKPEPALELKPAPELEPAVEQDAIPEQEAMPGPELEPAPAPDLRPDGIKDDEP